MSELAHYHNLGLGADMDLDDVDRCIKAGKLTEALGYLNDAVTRLRLLIQRTEELDDQLYAELQQETDAQIGLESIWSNRTS